MATSAKDQELKGLLKATRAGVRIIAFRFGGWDDDSLKGAAQIYSGSADLLTHYDASLLGRKDR